MELTQSWSASSQDFSAHECADLEDVAGNWSSQVQVVVTRPTVIVQGPIETRPERRKVRLMREDD